MGGLKFKGRVRDNFSATNILSEIFQHLVYAGSRQPAGKVLADIGRGQSVSGYHGPGERSNISDVSRGIRFFRAKENYFLGDEGLAQGRQHRTRIRLLAVADNDDFVTWI